MTHLDPQKHVLIIGGGTFGLSTALELLRSGHKNVTIVDPYPVPSPLSAGNDVNKVFQSIVESKFYTDLAQESLAKWRSDPVYKPAFHETGIIYGGTQDESVEWVHDRYQTLKDQGHSEVQLLQKAEDFIKLVQTSGMEALSLDDSETRFTNWKGYFQPKDCGWTYAALALKRAGEECVRLGAKIIVDSAESLVFNENGDCTGARTYSGQTIDADKTVICAGANSVKFLDYQGQLLAKCWTVGHIKLTDDEIAALKGIPVVLNLDRGFFFEPDANGDLKFCNEFPGYINMEHRGDKKVSIPVYRDEIPKIAEQQMRQLLREVLPKLADRDFNVAKICWCTDSPDRHFLFGDHPDHKGLVLGTGDSGKGFKYMPIVGEYISKIVLEGDSALPEDKRKAWKWRPQTGHQRDIFALQDRAGGTNTVEDLNSITEWTNGVHK